MGWLEPTGLTKERSEYMFESAENSDTVVLMKNKQHSRTNNIASRILIYNISTKLWLRTLLI